MRYTGHLILGGACWVGYSAAVNAVETLPHISLGSMLLALPLVLLASLLPDIDHPGSWVGRRTSPISDLISIFSHRGITHSMWAVLAIFWLFDQYGALTSRVGRVCFTLAGGRCHPRRRQALVAIGP